MRLRALNLTRQGDRFLSRPFVLENTIHILHLIKSKACVVGTRFDTLRVGLLSLFLVNLSKLQVHWQQCNRKACKMVLFISKYLHVRMTKLYCVSAWIPSKYAFLTYLEIIPEQKDREHHYSVAYSTHKNCIYIWSIRCWATYWWVEIYFCLLM